MRLFIPTIWLIILSACNEESTLQPKAVIKQANTIADKDNVIESPPAAKLFPPGIASINTGPTTVAELLAFAGSLIGTPYKYASVDPSKGFDCSGFITYVFNHFHIAVPRSSVDFTNIEKEVKLDDAKPGDLILFTGTDSTMRVVGHMGIIHSKENGEYHFIHSTSGKANGVTISALSKHYLSRFVKVIRIFPEND
jgi:cell wall-associated NlpC family hydrolase